MDLKSQTLAGVALAILLHLTANMAVGSETDPFPAIVLPVYQGGYNLESDYDRARGTKHLVYRIQTRYPAAEVIEYYDAVLNGRGWKPTFEICQRHWASQDDGRIKKEFQARQLFTSWEHPQFKLQISLLLEYQPSGTNPGDEVVVQCRLQPRLDNTKHDRFMDQLKESGQYQAFTKRLEAYRNPDGEVDPALLNRDIRNHKADEMMIAYKRILDEAQQQINAIIQQVNNAR